MNTSTPTRGEWLCLLEKIVTPVLETGARGALGAEMPVETHPDTPRSHRASVSPLEALGRSLAGIAPWLAKPVADPKEEQLRRKLSSLAREAITRAFAPAGPGHMPFWRETPEPGRSPYFPHQSLVDASYLARALLYAREELWEKLSPQARSDGIASFKLTRSHRPYPNNWLLFSALIETFLTSVDAGGDPARIDYALRQHEQWYIGDGLYKDGAEYHYDNYNSLVIHPYLLDILDHLPSACDDWVSLKPAFLERSHRYAVILERLIAPDGSFPTAGRSIVYRSGAFHLLAHLAWCHRLPAAFPPAQIRSALAAVHERVFSPRGTFDDQGWLRIGLAGHQPNLAENYISTGSLYKCLASFMPLGLPATDTFWSSPPLLWSSAKIWSGDIATPGDHPLGW